MYSGVDVMLYSVLCVCVYSSIDEAYLCVERFTMAGELVLHLLFVFSTCDRIFSLSFQNHRNSNNPCRTQNSYERRTYMATTTMTYSQTRHRNLSGPSGSCTTTRPPLDNRALATPPPGVPGNTISGVNGYLVSGSNTRDSQHRVHSGNRDSTGSSNGSNSSAQRDHRKLDRSLSDSEHDRLNGNHSGSGRGVNSARYKTELCRPFEESGHCKYGDKCQFAHGAHELRNLARHPKYKTERCRTYHTIGFCPYGPRCHFIHNEDERIGSKPPASHRSLPPASARPNNLSGLASLGSSFESVSPSSSSTSSPGNLSPSFLTDDAVPSAPSSFSPGSSQESSFSTSPRSSPVFNFPASDAAASLLTPLNIQTQQFYNNVVDMAALQFSAFLNFSQNQRNNCSISANLNVTANIARSAVVEPESGVEAEQWAGEVSDFSVPQPPASPVSLSDDSMGSTGSLDSSTSSFNMCNSPLDLGKSLRLPIFNRLSEL